jgi:hypothetical protein
VHSPNPLRFGSAAALRSAFPHKNPRQSEFFHRFLMNRNDAHAMRCAFRLANAQHTSFNEGMMKLRHMVPDATKCAKMRDF